MRTNHVDLFSWHQPVFEYKQFRDLVAQSVRASAQGYVVGHRFEPGQIRDFLSVCLEAYEFAPSLLLVHRKKTLAHENGNLKKQYLPDFVHINNYIRAVAVHILPSLDL